MTTTLGPYTVGERPDPILHTFEDASGEAIDLTGYTATAILNTRRTGESIELDCTIPTPADGVVRVNWPDDGIETGGSHLLEVKVESPGPIYISERFRLYVRDALPAVSA